MGKLLIDASKPKGIFNDFYNFMANLIYHMRFTFLKLSLQTSH